MLHGNIIGIVPQADVLDIHHQHIKFPHAFLAGHIGPFVIERQDGDAGFLIHAGFDVLARIGHVAEAVFRREDGRHIYAFFQQDVQNMRTIGDGTGGVGRSAEGRVYHLRGDFLAALQAPVINLVAHNAALVAQQGYPLPLQQGEISGKLFITQHNAFGRRTGAGKDACQEDEKEFTHRTKIA